MAKGGDPGDRVGRLGRFGFAVRAARDDDQPIADDLPASLLAVRHIGPRRARRLIDALGSEWEPLLNQAPERVFRTLRGIGPQQARASANAWRTRPRDFDSSPRAAQN